MEPTDLTESQKAQQDGLLVLIKAVNLAQSRAAYTLEEATQIGLAVKLFEKPSDTDMSAAPTPAPTPYPDFKQLQMRP